jgi:8-oxo-dGTP pyrophosphatase MutT (NUDIX family)
VARQLNDIDPAELESIITEYGEPTRLHFRADFAEFECELVRRSASKNRYHDITCFIPYDGGYVGIQKPGYAGSGIFRAPSGGANFGESLRKAAVREMYEETGLDIQLIRFVLDLTLDVVCSDGVIPWRSLVFGLDIQLIRFVLDLTLDVVCSDGVIPWRSLVFLVKATGGEMKPIDTHEIFDIKVVTREEMLGEITHLMEESGWGGFKYRAFLTKSFFERIDELGF